MAEAGKTLYLISTLASWTFKCASKKTMQLCLLTKTDFFLSKNSKICKTPKGWTQKPQSEDKWNEYLLRPASSE